MKSKIACILGMCLSLGACSKWDTPVYEPGNEYLQFLSSVMDSTVFSFKVHPGENECRLPLVLTINGTPAGRDREFVLVEDAAGSTAVRNTHYDLPESFVFRKGLFQDTCWITLKKTPELDKEDRRLVLKIKANADFLPGADMFSETIIRINDMISRPAWWNRLVSNYFLGSYSARKYTKFIEVTGVSDLTGATNDEIRYHALKFKRYLEENPQYEEDNSLMTVPVVG